MPGCRVKAITLDGLAQLFLAHASFGRGSAAARYRPALTIFPCRSTRTSHPRVSSG